MTVKEVVQYQNRHSKTEKRMSRNAETNVTENNADEGCRKIGCLRSNPITGFCNNCDLFYKSYSTCQKLKILLEHLQENDHEESLYEVVRISRALTVRPNNEISVLRDLLQTSSRTIFHNCRKRPVESQSADSTKADEIKAPVYKYDFHAIIGQFITGNLAEDSIDTQDTCPFYSLEWGPVWNANIRDDSGSIMNPWRRLLVRYKHVKKNQSQKSGNYALAFIHQSYSKKDTLVEKHSNTVPVFNLFDAVRPSSIATPPERNIDSGELPRILPLAKFSVGNDSSDSSDSSVLTGNLKIAAPLRNPECAIIFCSKQTIRPLHVSEEKSKVEAAIGRLLSAIKEKYADSPKAPERTLHSQALATIEAGKDLLNLINTRVPTISEEARKQQDITGRIVGLTETCKTVAKKYLDSLIGAANTKITNIQKTTDNDPSNNIGKLFISEDVKQPSTSNAGKDIEVGDPGSLSLDD